MRTSGNQRINTTPPPPKVVTPVQKMGTPDWWLLGIVLVLCGIGLITLLSASGMLAEKRHADMLYFFKRQLVFVGVGLTALTVAASMPRNLLYKLQYPLLFLIIILLILTISPLAVKIKGASRWLRVGPVSLQPMEFAKIALVLYLAYFLSTKQEMIKTFSRGVIPPFAVTGVLCLILLKQPDFGGAVMLSLLLFFMCLAGGTRLIYLAFSGAIVAGLGAWLMITEPYRFRRLLAVMDPSKVANDEGYQLMQSLYAFGSGGFWGKGLGASGQKLFFLPDAHTDFIMAILGEEMGFLGVSLIFLLMALFFWRCIRVALNQQELRDRLIAFGLTLILSLSMLLNMAVVLGAAPPKGLPMPFLSYGGSSMLATMCCVGLILNISRTARVRA